MIIWTVLRVSLERSDGQRRLWKSLSGLDTMGEGDAGRIENGKSDTHYSTRIIGDASN